MRTSAQHSTRTPAYFPVQIAVVIHHIVFRGARPQLDAGVRAGAIAAAGSPRTRFSGRITRPPANPDIISIMLVAAFADVVLDDQSTQREIPTTSEKPTRRSFHRAAP